MKKSSKKRARSPSKPRERFVHTGYESAAEVRVERALVENLIALQKVMINVSTKFDHLSTQISKLLELFEISARSLAKRDVEVKGNADTRVIMEKLDALSRQTGLIGRGLALIHESRPEPEPYSSERPSFPTQPKPISSGFPTQTKPTTGPSFQEYQRSIGSNATEETQ